MNLPIMASLRTLGLRQISRYTIPNPRITTQRRWAQVIDVRLLVTQPPQAIVEKYRARLQNKAKSEGLNSIDELKALYADKIYKVQREGAIEFPTIPQAPDTPVTQPNKNQSPGVENDAGENREQETEPNIPQAGNTPVKQPNKDGPPSTPGAQASEAARRVASGDEKQAIKGLDDILDLSKARDLPEKELIAIWRLRHASSPNNICAVIPAAAYSAMQAAAHSAPQFVLPVPHESQGAEIHFLQWTFDAASKTSTVLFTQLAEFKVRGEFAQPHTTITHHLDLADERGLVMMQGQVVEGRGVTPEQVKWLVMCLQRFYGGWEADQGELTGERKVRAEERRNLLTWFATGDERFTVERLMEEAERMG